MSLKFHHYGIAVKSIVRFMGDLGGIPADLRAVTPTVSDPEQDDAKLVILDWGGIRIELVEGKIVEKILDERDSVFYHLCFESDDFDKDISSARKPGVTMVRTPKPAALFNGRRVAFFYTLNVGLIEILEAADHYPMD